MTKSTDFKLGELDQAIVDGIEKSGRYKLWGWSATCGTTSLIFTDNQTTNPVYGRLGVTIDTYPVDEEGV